MKVLLFNGSPKVHGNTAFALAQMMEVFAENGVEAELIQVGSQNIRGCIACASCHKGNHKCVIDDLVNEVAPKLAQADGVVVASPVYYAGPNGTLISFLDRLFYSTGYIDKRMKVGASVVCARRGGCTATMDVLNKYFSINSMPIVTSQYWNQVHGSCPEEVMRDEEGLQTMRTLARNMAWLLQCIEAGRNAGVPLPAREPKKYTNFIR